MSVDIILPVKPAHELPLQLEEQRWLIKDLWLDNAVGVNGGEPKVCKSFFALDAGVSVASGTPCLRHFPVPTAGRVLLYAAEDALHIVRRRLEGICAAAGVRLQDIDFQVITAPTVRLDLPADRARLEQTVQRLRPRLLILDPFVRLHRIDENLSGEVAPLLAFLRELQRQYQMAIMVVHHAKKGGANIRAGQSLRGTSEFHAWGDSNVYLRRNDNGLTLTIEHRAAPSPPPIDIELVEQGESLALRLRSPASLPPAAQPAPSVDERILNALRSADRIVSAAELLLSTSIRKSTFYDRIEHLISTGTIQRTVKGYRLPTTPPAP
jgi:hypothetical protein